MLIDSNALASLRLEQSVGSDEHRRNIPIADISVHVALCPGVAGGSGRYRGSSRRRRDTPLVDTRLAMIGDAEARLTG